MFDKWFNQDIEKVLSKRNRVVVVDESAHLDLLQKVLPTGYKVFVVKDSIEELECKYTIEKYHRHDKVVVFTSTPKKQLTFIRDYCETCGCIEIGKFENYLTQKVFDELGLNISITSEELKAAAHNSVGKNQEYWEGLCRKGGERLFDIGTDILPFLNDPDGFCVNRDPVVIAAFFGKINNWLGRDTIEQPPKTLAQEVAAKILGSLLESQPEKKYLEVYSKWVDSKGCEISLKNYCKEVEAQYHVAEPWGVNPDHPFDSMDLRWVKDVALHLVDREYITAKLPRLRARFKTGNGKLWRKGLWGRILQLLEFDSGKIKEISSLDEALAYYTTDLYRVDTAIRLIYEEFWGDDGIIRPLQEFYNELMSPFLFKWFQYFGSYRENQKGLLLDRIQSAPGKIAIVVGDGIAYEISQNVIAKIGKGVKVANQFRCCGIPSETANNMSLLYKDDDTIETIHSKRESFLVAQVSKNIQFVQLDEINYQHTEAEVLICSCKDIDEIAEKLQHKALKFIGTIEDTLAEKIQFLLKNGFQEVVVTSDHGFVLTGILDESDKVEINFHGEVNKAERYIRTAEKQNVSAEYVEIQQSFGNYQYLYFTKNMKPFKTPGKYGYAHGGLAPQELIIPFVTFSSKASPSQELKISIANQDQLKGVVGENFSIHIKADDGANDLWSMERKVQLLFIDKGEQFNKSDIVTIKARKLIKREFSFEGRSIIDVIVIDALSKQTLTKVSVSQTIARDLGGL
ncbi:MAG: hypothetical protein Q7U88_03360 [Desulfocapsaceae bacterium]|nr:hypothetical protein [Desulfocapsaceae bacterium]